MYNLSAKHIFFKFGKICILQNALPNHLGTKKFFHFTIDRLLKLLILLCKITNSVTTECRVLRYRY